MSHENKEKVRNAFDAFSRRDQKAWSELCDPDFEAIPVGDWPEGHIRGRKAVWDFLITVEEPWEPGSYELTEVIEGGDQVLARQRRDLRGRASGVEVEYDYWVVFTFRNGKACRAE